MKGSGHKHCNVVDRGLGRKRGKAVLRAEHRGILPDGEPPSVAPSLGCAPLRPPPPVDPIADPAATPSVRYACQRCGNCCRWPGFVRLTNTDITALAGFLGLSEGDFIQRYTRLRPRRDGLALTDQPGGACVFLDGRNRCAVQSVKPEQCGGFPNAWNFPGWREVCEALPVPAES